MRQLNMEKITNLIHWVVSRNIKNFISDGKRGYASPEYAIGFIVMYSISFLCNALLNKLMPKVVFRMYESIFIPFFQKGNGPDRAMEGKSFISKAKVRGWSEKELDRKSISLIRDCMA
ncbi:MAG: hypothetical protein AB1611_13140 [bacterium]